jgi:hypothetical protein
MCALGEFLWRLPCVNGGELIPKDNPLRTSYLILGQPPKNELFDLRTTP